MKIGTASFCIVLGAIASAQSLDNTFEMALGTAGLSQDTARFDAGYLSFFSESDFQTVLYKEAHRNPWRIPFLLENARDELSAAADDQSSLLSTGTRLLGLGVRRSLIGNPIETAAQNAKRRTALADVIAKYRAAGLVKKETPNTSNLPTPVLEAAALILQVALDVAPLRRAAFNQVVNVEALYKRSRESDPASYDPESTIKDLAELKRIDLKYLSAASQDLSMACNAARNLMLGVSTSERYEFRLPTAWGEIVLTGGDNSKHGEQGALLVIDSGGDDTYVGLPATRSFTNWLSIVIDRSGNDKYVSKAGLVSTAISKSTSRANAKDPGPGSANLGLSFLYDIQGDDLYRSETPGIASAQYGASVVVDSDGRDTYDGYTHACGAATFGAALLEDLGGDDVYQGFNSIQGYGGVMGFGALIDRSGNDKYLANDTEIDFPSPQTEQHNVSLAQGAGYGRRADFLDGHSQSGGFGVLYDLAGNDTYSCGVFGQGVGYWEGIGALFDRVGQDTYMGQWYVQGAAAHFAIGYLEDENGDDQYTAPMNMAQGAGHDFSVGELLDRNGNDKYKAPNLSLGAGNANGMGIFMDFDGDDSYESLGITLGRGAEAPKGSLRQKCLCLGIFYDGNGQDTYPASTNWARNAARVANWTDRSPVAQESQLGIFWDR